MIVGKYVIRRAKTIKKRILERDNNQPLLLERMLQIYHSRFCGICFYRDEPSYEKMRKDIFKL